MFTPEPMPPDPMRLPSRFSEAIALLALTLPLGGCDSASASATPTAPPSLATIAKLAPAATKAQSSPQERAVLAAMAAFKQAIIDADVAELARTWTEDYTFINPQGAIVTRAQRL